MTPPTPPTSLTPLTPLTPLAPLAPPLTVPALLALELAAGELLPLAPLAGPDYAHAHALFEARSSQRQLLTDWLVQRLLRAAGDGPGGVGGRRPALRVLSVGAGDGMLDAAVIAALLDTDPLLELSWTCVEPLPGSAADCRSRLATAGPAARRRVEVHACAFEDLADPGSFDVVTFVHSLYYVPDVAAALVRAAALLAPEGRLLLAHAPHTGLNELSALLAPTSQGHRLWWSETTEGALGRLPLRGTAERLTGSLDLRDCLADAADADSSRAVLDFLVQAQLPPDLLLPVLDVLRALSPSGTLADVEHPLDVWDVGLRIADRLPTQPTREVVAR